MENLKMEIYNGVYSCKLNISKKEWLSVLNSPSCKQDYIDKLLLFCDEPDCTASCKHLAAKHNINAQAINSQITHFGMLASDILNIHIERSESTKETYWPFPMAKGRDTDDGLFDWTLRSELAEALKDYEILRFKHLLEYFVAHLEYCDSGKDTICGFSTYIKPLLDSKVFKYSGQGYKGNNIQNQIKNWSEYSICDICINIQPNYGGNYRTKKCYLNWRDTGINIYAEWDKSNVKSLIIGYCYWWNTPCRYEDVVEKQIADLGLFDDNYPNDELKGFYNHFKNELKQYYNEEGKYFEEEKKHFENQKLKQIMADIQPKVNLLTTNHNLILTGAPGTGKTYLAKQIAQQLIFGEVKENLTADEQKRFDEQCGFVQFHPSYDYTDFVEGLRPIEDENGNVGFERKDGVFKEFCIKALNNPNKNYVFIIDEINRGEISKIFGELFFSIDPGYRGEKGKVKTQYQNLVDKSDKFFDGFYVPENVYIIGTMNDIDRSVESMDFAMRRRFAFKEIKAEDRVDMLKENAKLSPHFDVIEGRMRNLNNCILSIQGLSSAYQIGASYFLKLENYLVNDQLEESSWTDLWNNHIEGLLFEYLRGTPNTAKDLEKLKNAYMNPDGYKYDNDGKVVAEDNTNE